MVTCALEDSGSLNTNLMDRVRMLEQRGKHILENANRSSLEPVSLRRALSSNNILNDSMNKSDSSQHDYPLTEEKRHQFPPIPTLPPLPMSTARRLFRSTISLNPSMPNFQEHGNSPKFIGENGAAPDALWSLQQELSQLALQREEERAKLTTALNQMRSSTEQARAEFERRLIEKEETLSRLEYNYDQSSKRNSQLEEELTITHEVVTSQERELDRIRSELSLHNNAANQLRALLNEVSEKMGASSDSNDNNVPFAPPLPPPSCQSVMVLAHSVSSCIRSAWDQAASTRAFCDRLNSEIANVKLECARLIERSESDRARGIAAIQAEADHALKLGQQRLSAAQDRLRAVEDQLELTRDDLTKQLGTKDSHIENLRAELCKVREGEDREKSDAILRATETERLLAESEASHLRASALAADADARSRQLELELDEMKRRYMQMEGELVGEHDKLCRIWQVDDDRTTRMRESESRESLLRQRIAELEEDLQSNMSEFQNTISDLTAKNQRCEEELAVAKSRVVTLSCELEKAIEFADEYKGELERVSKIAESAGKRQEDYSIECSNTIKLLDTAETKCLNLENENVRAEKELFEARTELDQLRKDLIASRLAASESVKAAQLLAKRHRELEALAKEDSVRLREEVDRLLKSLAEQETRLATVAAEKKQLEAASGCKQSEQLAAMRALARKLAAAERQLASSESEMRRVDRSEFDSLVYKLKLTEERLRDTTAEYKDALTQRKEAEKRMNEAVKVVELLKTKLDAEHSRVNFLHREAAKFHTESKQYRAKLEAAATYISRLESELVRRAKVGLVINQTIPERSNNEKTILSILADKDETAKHSRHKSRRRRENADKQLVLSPVFMDLPSLSEDTKKMIVTAKNVAEKCNVSTNTY